MGTIESRHDGGTGGAAAEHEASWNAIPWLVNGTLADDEVRRVRAHAGGCPACAAEIDAQRRLRDAVASIDARAPSGADVRADPAPRTVPVAGVESVAGRVGDVSDALDRTSAARRAIGFGIAAAGALLVVAVLVSPATRYRTLTDPAPRDAAEVRVRPAPGADAAAVRTALEAVGATDVAAPSPSGLVRATLPEGDGGEALEALRADPLFVVVTTD